MPTLSGKYSINELCNQLGVSPPYIRKIETHELLPPPEDGKVKGRRRLYSQKEASVISDVVVLRQLGFAFEEISYLKQLEDDLVPLIQKALQPSLGDQPDYINTVFHGNPNGVLHPEKLTNKERAAFFGKLQEHERLITRIRDAVAQRIQIHQDIQQRVNVWLGSRTLLLNKLKSYGN